MTAKMWSALVVMVLLALGSAGAARAGVPLTQSRPYQMVCESQGGTFAIAIDDRSLYCDKEGPLFTAFTEKQLDLQRTLCKRLYQAPIFGIQGFIRPDGVTGTGTFCAVAQ